MESDTEKLIEGLPEVPDFDKIEESKKNDTLNKIIGNAIREQLEKKDIHRNALAKGIFVSPSMITKIIKGQANSSIETLVRIAEYLDVSLDYLCGRTYCIRHDLVIKEKLPLK